MSAVLQSALDPNDDGDHRHYIIRRLLCRSGDLFGQIENSIAIGFSVLSGGQLRFERWIKILIAFSQDSERYWREIVRNNFDVFDRLRGRGSFILN